MDCRLVVAMKTKKFTELEADKHNYACSQMKCWITKSTKGCLSAILFSILIESMSRWCNVIVLPKFAGELF